MRRLLVLLLWLLSFGNAHAATLFATVESLAGSAFVSEDAGGRTAVSIGQRIYAGQTVTTSSDGEVHLETVDGGIVAIRPDTVFRVDDYRAEGEPDDRVFMSLLKGAVRSVTGWIGRYNAPAYRITTPTATIGIRGTDHETTVIDEADGDEPGTYDTVYEGITVLRTEYGEMEVTPEQFAFAPRFRAVAPSLLVRKPVFFGKRELKIEELVQKRKDALRERIEKLRDDRIRQLKEVRSERTGKAVRGKDAHEKTWKNRKPQAGKRDAAGTGNKQGNTGQGGRGKAERPIRKPPRQE